MNGNLEDVKKKLDEKSPSLCLAKWLQVTVHLQNGTTHSCHHPVPHKIGLEEIKQDSSALHNTTYKMIQRKSMLQGKRPLECEYCWKIEDANPENYSDRIIKSSEDWALPFYDKVVSSPWISSINPTYLEVSFGNECNLKCAYCSPIISSGVMSEFKKFGAYQAQPHFDLTQLKKTGEYPYSKDEHNPYVEAFWDWFPKLKEDLKVFRITGGEPLLNPNTFQFLEEVIASPLPHLDLAINSNLSVPQNYLDKFIAYTNEIMSAKKVKRFELYTSLDTAGPQAEYIRFGLNYDTFLANVERILREIPELHITFMCTFNVLSLPNFEAYLKKIGELKTNWPGRVTLNIPYLRNPRFMSVTILPESFQIYLEQSLNYMLRNSVFDEHEILQLRRILELMKHPSLSQEDRDRFQKQFKSFFSEYDNRKGTDLLKTFPEFKEFWESIPAP